MGDHAPAALFVLLSWWLGTGVVLYLDGLPRRTFPRSLAIAGAFSAVAVYGLVAGAEDTSTGAAYLTFGCALLIWGWHEMAFLMGYVTGPRKQVCPADARGWRRFRYAVAAVLHHEVALAATLAVIVALSWDAPNQVGAHTFAVLWVMRLSAKLNVYLGVRNLAVEFLPAHLDYLGSYFRKARLNPLMPMSIIGAGIAVFMLFGRATDPAATDFVVAGTTLVTSLLALALLEHIFLALPVPDAVLWRWALRPHDRLRPSGDA